MAYDRAADLEAQILALVAELRREVRLYIAAKQAGDTATADAWREQMQRLAQAHNVLVSELREIEGGSSTLRYLDRVGDVLIGGIKAGATFAIEAAGDVVATAGSAGGRALAGLALPVLIPVGLLLALLLWTAGKSGALRVRGVVA